MKKTRRNKGKEIQAVLSRLSRRYRQPNECVTCIAPFAHFLLRSNATSKKCDISNVKSTLLLGEAYYSFFFNLLFSNRR